MQVIQYDDLSNSIFILIIVNTFKLKMNNDKFY